MDEKRILIIDRESQSFELFKELLRSDKWQVECSTSIDLESVEAARATRTCLAILGDNFTGRELAAIAAIHKLGVSLLVASSGQNSAQTTSLNQLVSAFGIQFNQDTIIRPNLYRHFHPKEALIEEFVANRGLADAMRKYCTNLGPTSAVIIENLLISGKTDDARPASVIEDRAESLRIIYPYGCSLSVNKKESTIMMTSSRWTIPSGRAICAFHTPSSSPGGRLVAIGSAALMSDKFLDEEHNGALVRAILDYLAGSRDFHINLSDAKTASTTEDKIIEPSIDRLIDLPVSCLQECEPLPDDRAGLIDRHLFKIGGQMIPSICRAHRDLNVERGPLSLIKPHLERAIGLDLEPATHGFVLVSPETG